MKDESIEFEFIPGEEETASLVRRSFRIPVSDEEPVQVRIKQKKYFVFNISLTGVGFSADGQTDLEFGEILPDCELLLTNTCISGLTGKLMHCSISDSGLLQYGVQWLDLLSKQQQALTQIISLMKTRALENHDRNINNIPEV